MTDFLVGECAVRQLHARYIDAVWRKDYDAFGSCFVDDAEWRISGRVLRGKAEIVGCIQAVLPKFRRVLLTFRTPVVEVGNGVVTARTYVTEQSVLADGTPWAAIGTYFDRAVERDGRWLFNWRLFQTEYSGPPDFSAPFIDNRDLGPPPAMPPLDAVPLDHSGIIPRG